jgi:hypothetical protein
MNSEQKIERLSLKFFMEYCREFLSIRIEEGHLKRKITFRRASSIPKEDLWEVEEKYKLTNKIIQSSCSRWRPIEKFTYSDREARERIERLFYSPHVLQLQHTFERDGREMHFRWHQSEKKL